MGLEIQGSYVPAHKTDNSADGKFIFLPKCYNTTQHIFIRIMNFMYAIKVYGLIATQNFDASRKCQVILHHPKVWDCELKSN